MSEIPNTIVMSPDERRIELAGIFAAGILRLHARTAVPTGDEHLSVRREPDNSGLLRLEVSEETVLSVHSG